MTQLLYPKYVHSNGLTTLAYSRDGKFLFTTGTNQLIRKFTVGSDDEPVTLEHHTDDILGIAASAFQFATCSRDGTVNLFDVDTNEDLGAATRSSSAIHEVSFSRDGNWLACVSEDAVKLVDPNDILRSVTLENTPEVKHATFHSAGLMVALSGCDGNVRFYSLSSEEPQLVKSWPGLAPKLTLSDYESSKISWHPGLDWFAVPSVSRAIEIYSCEDWKHQKTIGSVHTAAITDLQWSPNGLYIASSGLDGLVIIWNVKTGAEISRQSISGVLKLDWRPDGDALSFTTSQGQLFTWKTKEEGLESGGSAFVNKAQLSSHKRSYSSSESDSAESDGLPGEMDWIVDDDGAGYAQEISTERRAEKKGEKKRSGQSHSKTAIYDKPSYPVLINNLSTPWKNNRRYLTMNSIGYIWSVAQESHNTITVSFFDRDIHREYHFTDHDGFDRASLSSLGCVFAVSSTTDDKKGSGHVFYKSHDSLGDNWTQDYDEKTTVDAVASSDSTVLICTGSGFVYCYNIYGSPIRVFRERDPVVSCSAWNDIFITVRQHQHSLVYSVEDAPRDFTYQKNDALAVPPGELRALFFSEAGDPCIFDSKGVLMVLSKWRDPLQAKWIPILDSQQLALSQGREEKYWPLGLADSKFQCVILKADQTYPSIPLPVFSEFDTQVPGAAGLEAQYLTAMVQFGLCRDRIGDLQGATVVERKQFSKLQLETDKLLLHLMQGPCKDGKLGRCLGLAQMIQTNQALEAAEKIAVKFGRNILVDKISDLINKRLMERDLLV